MCIYHMLVYTLYLMVHQNLPEYTLDCHLSLDPGRVVMVRPAGKAQKRNCSVFYCISMYVLQLYSCMSFSDGKRRHDTALQGKEICIENRRRIERGAGAMLRSLGSRSRGGQDAA